MNTFTGDLAHIKMNQYLQEAERLSKVSQALAERKARRRERVARAALRPVRRAWVMASAALHSFLS